MARLNKLFFLVLLLSGCGYRFAQITKNKCYHPIEDRYVWGISARVKKWWTYKDVPTIIVSNPLHWHKGIHKKCDRCGQKFCQYWTREKWINKIKIIK